MNQPHLPVPDSTTAFVPLKIIASGVALPPGCVTSAMLDERLGMKPGYVEKRSGIAHRFHADHQASQAQLGADALAAALSAQHIDPASIDLLIFASAIAVQALPCSAIQVLKLSPLTPGTAVFDINSSCVSFISALQVAGD
ncbi:hypothetical protein ERHA54_38470 [Erwinia rhapontici]|nr:hypothetical protein ERHA54_38470 [Erwinia rhapontici]